MVRAAAVCTGHVVMIRPDETVFEASRRMSDAGASEVVVVEQHAGTRVPVGILTARDLVTRAFAKTPGKAHTLFVAEVMSTGLVTASENDTLERLCVKMRAQGVKRLPILAADRSLRGLVRWDDVAKYALPLPRGALPGGAERLSRTPELERSTLPFPLARPRHLLRARRSGTP